MGHDSLVTTSDTEAPVASVDVTVTHKDLKAFHRYLRNGPQRKVLVRSYVLNVVIGVMLAGGGAVLAGPGGYLAGLVALLVICVGNYWVRAANVGDVLNAYEGRFVATPDELTADRPGIATRLEWSALRDVHQTAEHIFLLLTPVSGYIIPRHAFGDRQEFERFAEISRGGSGT